MHGRNRPFIFVLAGVNGAGKSSIGGHLLQESGLDRFNPDDCTRELRARSRTSLEEANARAWQIGLKLLQGAVASGTNHAFETTLGANTIPNLLIEATRTHDVHVWFCGLANVELHLQRVAARVRRGGHDIPETKIRERWDASRRNLMRLMPHLASLQVFDNSRESAPGTGVPPPILVLEMRDGMLLQPQADDHAALAAVPEWAAPLVELAIRSARER